MLPISQCIICSGTLKEQEVTEIVRGAGNTATLTVKALVCQKCGERYYNADVVRRFEDIKAKLERQETGDFVLVGQSFTVN
ncbi:YgiT-type zinc finger protein [Crocosphaera sp. XPORK-15E]|uniref:YgiT-type zinc finger protein n=1 Tax=Crocosphaera sp. XPORK-15E TaxID=3110247 RepID=UPI002B1EC475|nr:YgiT-type zinc finger protein [Crocosphaera sp. XPORK-15E]MEA5535086.1 YgiT-type zinc finger protein [Crocosphaera sp. XPORK-15E]